MLRAEDVCILSWNYSEYEIDLFLNCCILWSIFKELLVICNICTMDRERTFEHFYSVFQIK